MKVVLALVLGLGFALCGCATRQQESASDVLVGNWRGSVRFDGMRPRDVEINIRRADDQQLRAVVFYVDTDCRGELAVEKSEVQTLRFVEAMLSSSHDCGGRREISLSWGREGRVIFASAKPPGQGSLYRFPISSTMSHLLNDVSSGSTWALPAAPSRAGPSLPNPRVDELAQIVDLGLLHWSQLWPNVRYVFGSPRITEALWMGAHYVVRGTFTVVRREITSSVSFAAEMPFAEGRVSLAGLCMQNASDAAPDCYDAEQVGSTQRRQALQDVLRRGLVAATPGTPADAPNQASK